MSEGTEDRAPGSLLDRALGRIRHVVGPTVDALFVGPVRGGRVRLAGLDAPAWVLTVVGLVGLGALTVSVLVAERYRRGTLVDLGTTSEQGQFLPEALLPVTLGVLGLAWTLIASGAARASWLVRVVAAVAFLLLNATLSDPFAIAVGDDPALTVGPMVARIAYFAVPGILLLSVALERLRRWRSLAPWVLPFVLGAVITAFYASLLWVHLGTERVGLAQFGPSLLEHAVSQIETVLLPMAMIGGLGVIGFAHTAAGAAVTPAWRVRRLFAVGLLAAIVVTKLWVQVWRHRGEWATSIADSPAKATFTIGLLAALVVGVVLLRRLRTEPGQAELVTERLTLTAVLVLSGPLVIPLLVVGTQSFVLAQFEALGVAKAILKFPFDLWSRWSDLLFWVPALAVSLLLLLRPGRPARREVAGGMVLISLWALAWQVPHALRAFPGFDVALLDVGVTVLVAGYAAWRGRSLSAGEAIGLAGVVVFSWLVGTQGDWIAITASTVGIPGIVVVLFGLWWTVSTGSAFTWTGGRRMPRPSRPLLWLGYLILALSLVHWIEVTHGSDLTADAGERAFLELGIPLAAWLLARRPFAPPADVVQEPVEPAPASAPVAVGVGPSEGEPAGQGTDGARPP